MRSGVRQRSASNRHAQACGQPLVRAWSHAYAWRFDHYTVPLRKFELESGGRQSVQSSPQKTVYGDDHRADYHRRSQQYREVARVGRAADHCTQPGYRECLIAEPKVLRDDARVPGSAGGPAPGGYSCSHGSPPGVDGDSGSNRRNGQSAFWRTSSTGALRPNLALRRSSTNAFAGRAFLSARSAFCRASSAAEPRPSLALRN